MCTDVNSEIGKERIRTLKALGLLNNRSAQEILNDYGLLKAQNEFAPIYDAYQVPLCVSVTYANAYGRFDVAENLCDYSLAALNPSSGPGPITKEKLRQLYAIGNGIPPSGGVHVINNSRNLYAPISTPDGGAEGALSLRRVVTGGGEGAGSISREQKAREHAWHRRLDAGVREVRATGYLHGKLAAIVQGRNERARRAEPLQPRLLRTQPDRRERPKQVTLLRGDECAPLRRLELDDEFRPVQAMRALALVLHEGDEPDLRAAEATARAVAAKPGDLCQEVRRRP